MQDWAYCDLCVFVEKSNRPGRLSVVLVHFNATINYDDLWPACICACLYRRLKDWSSSVLASRVCQFPAVFLRDLDLATSTLLFEGWHVFWSSEELYGLCLSRLSVSPAPCVAANLLAHRDLTLEPFFSSCSITRAGRDLQKKKNYDDASLLSFQYLFARQPSVCTQA